MTLRDEKSKTPQPSTKELKGKHLHCLLRVSLCPRTIPFIEQNEDWEWLINNEYIAVTLFGTGTKTYALTPLGMDVVIDALDKLMKIL